MRRSNHGTKWLLGLGVVLAVLMVAGPASADDYVGTPPPNAGSVDTGGAGSSAAGAPGGGAAGAVGGGSAAEVKHDRERRAGQLAATGFVPWLLFVAVLLVGTGLLLKRKADRTVA